MMMMPLALPPMMLLQANLLQQLKGLVLQTQLPPKPQHLLHQAAGLPAWQTSPPQQQTSQAPSC